LQTAWLAEHVSSVRTGRHTQSTSHRRIFGVVSLLPNQRISLNELKVRVHKSLLTNIAGQLLNDFVVLHNNFGLDKLVNRNLWMLISCELGALFNVPFGLFSDT
jgi:hypothetical protein